MRNKIHSTEKIKQQQKRRCEQATKKKEVFEPVLASLLLFVGCSVGGGLCAVVAFLALMTD